MRLMSFPTRYNAISGFDLEIVEYITDDGERIPAEQVEGVTDLASRMRERDAGAR
jgi:GTP cyclohydrolase II